MKRHNLQVMLSDAPVSMVGAMVADDHNPEDGEATPSPPRNTATLHKSDMNNGDADGMAIDDGNQDHDGDEEDDYDHGSNSDSELSSLAIDGDGVSTVSPHDVFHDGITTTANDTPKIAAIPFNADRRFEQPTYPTVRLYEQSKWMTLHRLQSEQMYTVAGRKLFPTLVYELSNLHPHRRYAIAVDIVPVSENLWRFDRETGQWVERVGQRTKTTDPTPRLYYHPLGIANGTEWPKELEFPEVRVGRVPVHLVKAANDDKQNDDTSQDLGNSPLFYVQSAMRYQPRLHIFEAIQHVPIDRSDTSSSNYSVASANDDDGQQEWLAYTYEFECQKFFASTHYRNQLLSDYKIMLNVHSTALLNKRIITKEQREWYQKLHEGFAKLPKLTATRVTKHRVSVEDPS